MIKYGWPWWAFFNLLLAVWSPSTHGVQLEVVPDVFHQQKLPEYVSHKAPQGLYKDSIGRLWLVYPKFVLQIQGDQVIHLNIPKFTAKAPVSVEFPRITEYSGQLIIGWKDRLLTFDRQSRSLQPFHEQDFIIENRNDTILGVDVDAQGRLWVMTVKQLMVLEDPMGQFKSFSIPKAHQLTDSYFFMSLTGNAFGDIWLASQGWGLLRIDAQTLEIERQYGATDSAPV